MACVGLAKGSPTLSAKRLAPPATRGAQASTGLVCGQVRTFHGRPWSRAQHLAFAGPDRGTSVADPPAPSSQPPDTAANASTDDDGASTSGRKLITSAATVGGLLLLIAAGALFQDQIKDFLVYFSSVVDDMGPLGVVLYMIVYAGLEILAVPAIPLTMTAGAIFGIVPGSIIVSFAGAVAAAIAFIIARYVARDRFLAWAQQSKQFRAVDRVIGRDGFKVVTMLRLSPLLPLAASNYFYGLTSVSLKDYFFGSWLGMLPGTIAYVSAGHVSAAAFLGTGEVGLAWWQIAAAFGVSALVIGYVGSQAKQALAELEEEEAAEAKGAQGLGDGVKEAGREEHAGGAVAARSGEWPLKARSVDQE